MTTILALDNLLFLFINHLPHPFWSESLALILSGVNGSSILLWILLGGWLLWREENKNHQFIAPFITTAVTSLLVTDVLLKPFIERVRPSPMMGAWVMIPIDRSFSFPSGHATMAFALATVLAAQEPKFRRWFYGLAVLVALSRVYLGVHYPSDVIFGAFLGWGIGQVSLYLFSLGLAARKPRPRRSGKRRNR